MMSRDQAHVPEELEGLEKALSDTYFCNFSMFQSVPDCVGGRSAVPDLPDPPAQRGADAARDARRHHV